MHKSVARLNIEHYRARLVEEKDETTRRTLRRLLDEEERKLALLLEAEQNQKQTG